MRFVHTNIIARDWKRLADFYMNVFECKAKPPERSYSGEWLDRATGLTNARLTGVHLLLPGHGDQGPTLEIFCYDDIIETKPMMANHSGFSHIAFEVEDVSATLKKALDNGAQALGEVTEKLVENIGVLNFVYFRDPEGNIVEILAWKPL